MKRYNDTNDNENLVKRKSPQCYRNLENPGF